MWSNLLWLNIATIGKDKKILVEIHAKYEREKSPMTSISPFSSTC
jgi:hypothetical protein